MGWVMGGDTGGARAGLGLNQDHIFRPWKPELGHSGGEILGNPA